MQGLFHLKEEEYKYIQKVRLIRGRSRVIRAQCSWIFVFLSAIFENPRSGLKKAIGLTTTLLLRDAFFYTSLPSLHDLYEANVPNFTEGENTRQRLSSSFFFSLTLMQTLGFNPWKICKHLTIWRRWGNREFTCKWRVKLRHVIYVWLVILSYPFLILVRNMVLAKVNIFTSRARYKANIRLQIWLQLQVSTPYEFLVHARMLYF